MEKRGRDGGEEEDSPTPTKQQRVEDGSGGDGGGGRFAQIPWPIFTRLAHFVNPPTLLQLALAARQARVHIARMPEYDLARLLVNRKERQSLKWAREIGRRDSWWGLAWVEHETPHLDGSGDYDDAVMALLCGALEGGHMAMANHIYGNLCLDESNLHGDVCVPDLHCSLFRAAGRGGHTAAIHWVASIHGGDMRYDEVLYGACRGGHVDVARDALAHLPHWADSRVMPDGILEDLARGGHEAKAHLIWPNVDFTDPRDGLCIFFGMVWRGDVQGFTQMAATHGYQLHTVDMKDCICTRIGRCRQTRTLEWVLDFYGHEPDAQLYLVFERAYEGGHVASVRMLVEQAGISISAWGATTTFLLTGAQHMGIARLLVETNTDLALYLLESGVQLPITTMVRGRSNLATLLGKEGSLLRTKV